MNEVSGRGLYPGPHQPHRCNKTVYGNAVWHTLSAVMHWPQHASRLIRNPIAGSGPKAQGKSFVRTGW